MDVGSGAGILGTEIRKATDVGDGKIQGLGRITGVN